MSEKHIYLMIANESGDTRIMISWDPKDADSVREMKERFTELKSKGYIFFECKGFAGKYKPKGKPIKDFNKSTGRLVAEKYFDNDTLEHIKSEEVILTSTENHTEETPMIDPSEEELKSGTTIGASNMVSGG